MTGIELSGLPWLDNVERAKAPKRLPVVFKIKGAVLALFFPH